MILTLIYKKIVPSKSLIKYKNSKQNLPFPLFNVTTSTIHKNETRNGQYTLLMNKFLCIYTHQSITFTL